MIVNYGAQALAWQIGSNLPNNYIQYCAIGSGSGTVVNTQTVLFNERDRNSVTGSPDFTTAKKVTFQFDFNSFEMSGINLTEFGFLGSYPASVGSVWQIERIGSVVFDGTNELQISNVLEVINQ
ncbi:MAG: hypothetical protein AAB875_00535 [Patescibacteria group bacterium]